MNQSLFGNASNADFSANASRLTRELGLSTEDQYAMSRQLLIDIVNPQPKSQVAFFNAMTQPAPRVSKNQTRKKSQKSQSRPVRRKRSTK